MINSYMTGELRVVVYSMKPGVGLPSGQPLLHIPVSVREGVTGNAMLTLSQAVAASPQAQIVPVTLGLSTVTVSKEASLPKAFSLGNARPNPFNPSTQIAYDVPQQAHITVTVYNLLGQEVVRLVNEQKAPGRYVATWSGRNAQGAGVASGVYLFRLTSSTGLTQTRRMTLLK